MRKLVLSYFLICCCSLLYANPFWYNVKEFGAAGDSIQLDTRAIQKTIDHCNAQGGGQVYFPPGKYRSGTIILKDNVTLHISTGATVLASQDVADYMHPMPHTKKSALIFADGAKNIGISGKGTIDGQARREYRDLEAVDKFIGGITENARQSGVEMKMYYIVPPNNFMVLFADCQNVRIENVTMRESSFWTCHLLRCENVQVRGVFIYSDLEKGINADGLDISSCRDVTVSDCVITTGDDAIVLKSRDRARYPCENITVTNCILTSSSTALKLGTETWGDFRHITFNNCVIRDSNRGLSIVVRDGATVEDVLFSNITIETRRRHFNWWGNADPIWLVVTRRRASSELGKIKNVRFENIIAHAQGTSRIEADSAGCLENIQLSDVQIFMEAEDYLDKRADHGFYARYVDGLKLNNFSVRWDREKMEEKWASAVYLDSLENLTIRHFRGNAAYKDKYPAIEIRNGRNVLIDDAAPIKNVDLFIRISGEESDRIILDDIDRGKLARKTLKRKPDVPRNALEIND